MINKSSWKEFKFDKIFTISRGKRLVKLDQINGDIAYISSSKKNNGVDNYILPPSDMTIYENALTLSNSGSVGYCFYHPYKFVSSDHCTVIQIKDKRVRLDNHIALFLKPIIESMRSKYNFAREINNERLSREIVILPVDKNDFPDWLHMKEEVKKISNNVIFNNKEIIHRKKEVTFIDTEKWGEFEIGKTFDISLGYPVHSQEVESGNTAYVTRTAKNNGIETFVSNDKINEGGAITIGAEGCVAFYQENNFITGNKINIIRYDGINKYNALFICSVINCILRNKFNYGYAIVSGRLKKLIIKLPTTFDRKLDLEFMENYIKSTTYSSSL